ncbi:MAG: MFS transporter [Clostridia bacterium]|nr:MFS transporter [Clostridia bacterium]
MEKFNGSAAKFTGRQKLIAILCFGAYLSAYLMRVNISIALPEIAKYLGYTDISAIGYIPGAFFWTYALGQLISGWLGDRISPKYMIAVGLFCSAVINLTFSFASSLTAMIILWAINGAFQSMLWAPIMKTIVLNFEGTRLGKMTFLMSMTLVVGYSLSWSASTIIKTFLDWRFVFSVPAVIGGLFAVVWTVLYKKEESVPAFAQNTVSSKFSSLFRMKYFPATVVLMLAVGLLHGIIKESINTWLPTMMDSFGSFSLSSTLGVLVIVPVINFIGIVFMRMIMAKGKSNSFYTVSVLLIISFAVALLSVFISLNTVALVVMTIALSGLTFASNPVLTAFFPIEFSKWNCVSTVAGTVDCMIYFGAALSSPLTGFLADGSDWSKVTLMWSAVLLVAVIASVLLKKVSAAFFKTNTKS